MTNKTSARIPAARRRPTNGHGAPPSDRGPLALALPSRGLRSAITQWTIGIKPTWTVTEVRSALQSHADGDFSSSAKLVRSMLEDDVIPAVLSKRVSALLGEDFSFEPVEGKHRQVQQSVKLIKRFEPQWWDAFPESELEDLLAWKHMLGVAIGVFDWTLGAAEWKPKLRTLDPQFLRFDRTRQVFIYRAREGEFVVTPGDGRWVLLCDGSTGWMRGLVRPLALPWVTKQLTIRDWNRYNERHGLPLIKAMVPAIADDDDADAFYEDLKELGNETVALLPTHMNDAGAAFDIQVLEATDKNWESFEAQIDRSDRRATILLLGANLSTEVSGQGSRAAAGSHSDEMRKLAQADGQKYATELRWQGLLPWCAYNVAGVDLTITPWPHWNTDPPTDLKGEADTLSVAGDAVRKLQDAGFPVDLLVFAEHFGIPLEATVDGLPSKGTIFQYHLTFGIVTVNEARARLGLPPLPDGDRPPTPPLPPGVPPNEGDDPDDDEPDDDDEGKTEGDDKTEPDDDDGDDNPDDDGGDDEPEDEDEEGEDK